MKRLLRVGRWVLIAAGVVTLGLFLAHLVLRPHPDLANSEQYVVLSAYIEPNLTGDSHDLGSRRGLVVIDGRTTFSEQFVNSNKFKQYVFLLASTGHVRATIPQLRRSLVFEFWATNLRDTPLERRFQLSARYDVATEQEMRLYLSPSQGFDARFPANYGVLTFSRVAFNRDLTEAFFYTEHLCGMCGEGKFVFMRKAGGKWVVDSTASTWIS
jgi:hypothetical protein